MFMLTFMEHPVLLSRILLVCDYRMAGKFDGEFNLTV